MKQILNDGLKKAQERSVKETERKLLKALEKQNKNTKVNISQLARDSGVSRTHIINKYGYLYEGRKKESAIVTILKEEIGILKNRFYAQNKKIRELELVNKKLSDKLIEFNAIFDDMKLRRV